MMMMVLQKSAEKWTYMVGSGSATSGLRTADRGEEGAARVCRSGDGRSAALDGRRLSVVGGVHCDVGERGSEGCNKVFCTALG